MLRVALAAVLLLACSGASDATAATPDPDGWERVLARHTRATSLDGMPLVVVEYATLARGSADLDGYLAWLATAKPERLSPAGRKAFWMNAYNALAVEVVRRAWPIESIRDAGGLLPGSVWRQQVAPVAGRPRSLDEIEHEILRPMGDPRVHAGIVCASVSCPDLRREPFTAERVDAQLDEQMRRFLANPGKGMRLDRADETLWVSSIFDWFEEDFAAAGGVVPFVASFAPSGDATWLRRHGDRVRVRHLDYDWRVNAP